MRCLVASKVVQSGKSVLLYSGGLDSVCADHLLKPDVLVHVSTGLTTEETMAVLVVRDYVYDPKGTVERDPIFERHLAQIKQHVEW